MKLEYVARKLIIARESAISIYDSEDELLRDIPSEVLQISGAGDGFVDGKQNLLFCSGGYVRLAHLPSFTSYSSSVDVFAADKKEKNDGRLMCAPIICSSPRGLVGCSLFALHGRVYCVGGVCSSSRLTVPDFQVFNGRCMREIAVHVVDYGGQFEPDDERSLTQPQTGGYEDDLNDGTGIDDIDIHEDVPNRKRVGLLGSEPVKAIIGKLQQIRTDLAPHALGWMDNTTGFEEPETLNVGWLSCELHEDLEVQVAAAAENSLKSRITYSLSQRSGHKQVLQHGMSSNWEENWKPLESFAFASVCSYNNDVLIFGGVRYTLEREIILCELLRFDGSSIYDVTFEGLPYLYGASIEQCGDLIYIQGGYTASGKNDIFYTVDPRRQEVFRERIDNEEVIWSGTRFLRPSRLNDPSFHRVAQDSRF